MHINVLYDGAPHLSIESNDLLFQSLEGGVYTFSAFGRTATATLDANTGTFTWHVEPRRRLYTGPTVRLLDISRVDDPGLTTQVPSEATFVTWSTGILSSTFGVGSTRRL